VQFGLRCVAHLGFGRPGADGRLSLLGAGPTLADLYFDRTAGRFELSPATTQGLVGDGDAFAHFDGAGCDCRPEALDSLQDTLSVAAGRILGTTRPGRLPLRVPGGPPFDQQVYDGILSVRMIPLRSTLYVIVTPTLVFDLALPDPVLGTDGVDWANGSCDDGRGVRGAQP